jgi:integrase
VFQDHKQKAKLGDKCPWSVGWFEDGRKRSKSIGSKSMAGKYARTVEKRYTSSLIGPPSKKWDEFAEEWLVAAQARLRDKTYYDAEQTLKRFRKIVKPLYVSRVKMQDIETFVSKRMATGAGQFGTKVSASTVNKELRHLKAALRCAHDWGHLDTVPKIKMLKEPKRVAQYMPPEDFERIFNACGYAKTPSYCGCTPEQWWKSLLAFAYMTGWRIGEILALRASDVDLDILTAITRHDDNKGNRDEITPLHEALVPFLKPMLDCGNELVFPWKSTRVALSRVFMRIQKSGGIDLTCERKHTHTDWCRTYGFHDIRRAFATMNAENLTAESLQAMMRHTSYSTTQRYINVARLLRGITAKLSVPSVLARSVNGVSP